MNIDWNNYALLAVAAVTVVFGAGRLTRIITHDDFPPAAWARSKWDAITRDGSWSKLAHCFWCAGPWVTLVALASGYFSSLHPIWFAFWGWLALSYMVSILVARDEPLG